MNTATETQEYIVRPRVTALIAYAGAVLFVALFAVYGIAPTSPVVSLLGVAAHLVLFPVVTALPAPSWAKAAGYGWLVVDIVSNLMALGGLPDASSAAVRFGGHVVAALWIASASWYLAPMGQPTREVLYSVNRIVGSLLATILFVTAVGSPWLPAWLFAFAMPLLPLWLVCAGLILSRSRDAQAGVSLPAASTSQAATSQGR